MMLYPKFEGVKTILYCCFIPKKISKKKKLKKIYEELKMARAMYILHKKNNTTCINFWENECKKVRGLLSE